MRSDIFDGKGGICIWLAGIKTFFLASVWRCNQHNNNGDRRNYEQECFRKRKGRYHIFSVYGEQIILAYSIAFSVKNSFSLYTGAMQSSLFIVIGILGAGLIYMILENKRHTADKQRVADEAAQAALLQAQSAGQDNTGFQLLLQQLGELQRTVDQKLGDSEKSIRDGLMQQSNHSARVISDITERLTRLDENTKQVLGFAEGLQQMQDILKNPKQRGILGEYYLETLLKNILPPTGYQMQYAFPDGTIVDAAVFVREKVIPIDSKFSLENYNRLSEATDPLHKERLEKQFVNDLKERISETAKYIQPENGTMDFAFMFIPHEAIYYDLLVNKVGAISEETENLIQRAASKYRVIIVSPTSFLAYLQTVLQGLKALQIEESAKEIRKRIEELSRHLQSYEEYHNKLGTSLKTVVNHYNTASKELKKVDKDMVRIVGDTSSRIDPLLLTETEIERTTE